MYFCFYLYEKHAEVFGENYPIPLSLWPSPSGSGYHLPSSEFQPRAGCWVAGRRAPGIWWAWGCLVPLGSFFLCFYLILWLCVHAHSVVSDSATPWTVATRLLCPWILQARILEWVAIPSPADLPNSGIEPAFLYCRQILYHLSHQGSPTEGKHRFKQKAGQRNRIKKIEKMNRIAFHHCTSDQYIFALNS